MGKAYRYVILFGKPDCFYIHVFCVPESYQVLSDNTGLPSAARLNRASNSLHKNSNVGHDYCDYAQVSLKVRVLHPDKQICLSVSGNLTVKWCLTLTETPEPSPKEISKGSVDRDIALAEISKEKGLSYIKAWEKQRWRTSKAFSNLCCSFWNLCGFELKLPWNQNEALSVKQTYSSLIDFVTYCIVFSIFAGI
ncbi:unnamed protein product [Ilex paraguariensis]|uniref:Uncharacterized protein n=1 Tax=Ilex paraguariensis TaxID=185542 RepID=A0ABC8UGD0_9AQUA